VATVTKGDGRIKGSVTNQARREVVAARIVARVLLPDREMLFLTTSDEAGVYRFENLPAGFYRLQALRTGYEEVAHDDVEVRPPFRNIIDFRLPTRLPPEPGPIDREPPPAPRAPPVGLAPIHVTGLVADEEGSPVADAEVAFSLGTPPRRNLIYSRADGTLDYALLYPATYELSVTVPGSIPIRIPEVTVSPGRSLEIQVRLVDFPVELAARRGLILPPEEPLPPRHWLPIPPPGTVSPPVESFSPTVQDPDRTPEGPRPGLPPRLDQLPPPPEEDPEAGGQDSSPPEAPPGTDPDRAPEDPDPGSERPEAPRPGLPPRMDQLPAAPDQDPEADPASPDPSPPETPPETDPDQVPEDQDSGSESSPGDPVPPAKRDPSPPPPDRSG
jgi:hypothetical protein